MKLLIVFLDALRSDEDGGQYPCATERLAEYQNHDYAIVGIPSQNWHDKTREAKTKFSSLVHFLKQEIIRLPYLHYICFHSPTDVHGLEIDQTHYHRVRMDSVQSAFAQGGDFILPSPGLINTTIENCFIDQKFEHVLCVGNDWTTRTIVDDANKVIRKNKLYNRIIDQIDFLYAEQWRSRYLTDMKAESDAIRNQQLIPPVA